MVAFTAAMNTNTPADQALQVRVYRELEDLQALQPAWEALLASYSPATTFSTFEWLVPWWRSFGKNQKLLVVGFFDADSSLVALAPLSLTRIRLARTISLRLMRLMGDGSNDSDNLDLPVRAGFEERFAESLLHFLERERSSWDFVELNTMPPQSPGANALLRLLEREKWVSIEKRRPTSVILLPATWKDYLRQLSSEDQKNLTRYARRLERRYEVRIHRCSEESELPKFLEALFVHHQARWEAAGERGSFGSSERRSFYYELSRSLLGQGKLDLWVLELDGRVVAAQFGFRYGERVFQLQEGNDPKHASDRVGFLLRGHVMKELIAQGVRTYDFLGGAPGYKARWGAQAGHYLDLRFARPFSAGATYLLARDYAGRSKSWLRRNLPTAAWNTLHKINVGVRRAEGTTEPPKSANEEERAQDSQPVDGRQ